MAKLSKSHPSVAGHAAQEICPEDDSAPQVKTANSSPGSSLSKTAKSVLWRPLPPKDIPTYDLGSAVIAPGLVASYNDLGMHSSVDDNAEADAGQVRTADVLDPHYRPLRELIEGGYTASLFAPVRQRHRRRPVWGTPGSQRSFVGR